jgi:hypothetical protein
MTGNETLSAALRPSPRAGLMEAPGQARVRAACGMLASQYGWATAGMRPSTQAVASHDPASWW